MTAPSTADLVNTFCAEIEQHFDRSQLDGPVRMDNTHTVVIVPVKGKGPIHVHLRRNVDSAGVEDVIQQVAGVPSLTCLLRS